MTTKKTKKEQVYEYFLAHPDKNNKNIADDFGVSRQYVSAVLNEYGVTTEFTYNRIRLTTETEDVRKILTTLTPYTTREELHTLLGVTMWRVSGLVGKLNISLNGNTLLRSLTTYEETETLRTSVLGSYRAVSEYLSINKSYIERNKASFRDAILTINKTYEPTGSKRDWWHTKQSLGEVISEIVGDSKSGSDLLKRVITQHQSGDLDIVSYLYTVSVLDELVSVGLTEVGSNPTEFKETLSGMYSGAVEVDDKLTEALIGQLVDLLTGEDNKEVLGEHVVFSQMLSRGIPTDYIDVTKPRNTEESKVDPLSYQGDHVYCIWQREWVIK